MLTALLAGLPRRWVLALLALHAPVSEVVQATLLPSRDGDVWDAVADLTGVGLALGAFLVIAQDAPLVDLGHPMPMTLAASDSHAVRGSWF